MTTSSPLEHTVELYQALPDAALAIVPNASHLLLHEHPDELTRMVGGVLAEDPAPTMMPLPPPQHTNVTAPAIPHADRLTAHREPPGTGARQGSSSDHYLRLESRFGSRT